MAAVGVAVAVGCYNPKVGDGTFVCNSRFEPECPSGLTCDRSTTPPLCKRRVSDGGVLDRPMDKPVEAMPERPVEAGVDMVVEMMCLVAPVAGCTPDLTKKCDPTCQSGCNCREKCSVNTAGALTCNPAMGTRRQGTSCDIINDGSPQQTDNCEPGLVCLRSACGELCSKFCHVDADCPGSSCSRSTAGGLKICDVPIVDCNPVRSLGPCPGTSQGCYLSPSVVDRTTCDCPFGAVGENASCTFSRDCFPGLACVDPTGSGVDFRCRRVCSLDLATLNNPCPVANCKALNGSKKYGFCN